jgi:hypothetical protein
MNTKPLPPHVTDEDIEGWCRAIMEQEIKRTFGRDDLCPGNPQARMTQAINVEIVRRLRAAMAQ